MDSADPDVARGWVGKAVVDPSGAQIGMCTAVLTGDATGLPKWLCTDLGGGAIFVPALDAVESGGQLRVAVSAVEVAGAPPVGPAGQLSQVQEATLNRYYGVTAAGALSPGRRGRRVLVALAGVFTVLGALAGAAWAVRRLGALRFPVPVDLGAPGARAGASTAPAVTATDRPGARFGRRATPPPATSTGASSGRAGVVVARGAGTAFSRLAAPTASRAASAGRSGLRGGQRAGKAVARLAATTASRAASAGRSGLRGGQRVGEAVGSVPDAVSERSEQLQKRWRKVMGKAMTVLGFGAGYVLGTRAGRERYQQLKQTAVKVGQHPQVQQARDRLTTVVNDKLQSSTGQGTQLAAAKARAVGVSSKLRRRQRPAEDDLTDTATTPTYPAPDPGMPGGSPPEPGFIPDPVNRPVDPRVGGDVDLS